MKELRFTILRFLGSLGGRVETLLDRRRDTSSFYETDTVASNWRGLNGLRSTGALSLPITLGKTELELDLSRLLPKIVALAEEKGTYDLKEERRNNFRHFVFVLLLARF